MNTRICPCQHKKDTNICKQCCNREKRIEWEILEVYFYCKMNGIKISKKQVSLIFTNFNQTFNLL